MPTASENEQVRPKYGWKSSMCSMCTEEGVFVNNIGNISLIILVLEH